MEKDKAPAQDPNKKNKLAAAFLPQLISWLPFLIFWLWIWNMVLGPADVSTMAYSEFKERLSKKEVVEVALSETEITGLIAPGGLTPQEREALTKAQPWYAPFIPPDRDTVSGTDATPEKGGDAASKPLYFRTVRVEDPELVNELTAAGVDFTGVRPSLFSQLFMSWIVPLFIMFLIWTFIARRFANARASVLGIGKSRAKLMVDKETGVTFDDVAGCDEAKHELKEVVDFLKSPARYKALGAQIPKGVLLVGPPGTGKTLLARAVAGEAKVPFFSISGSDFVEMFVGVGAARVRDMFADAKKQAPCIVFIDEIDTIGRHRTVHVGAVNDEREQTLNQLLSEMDGFEPNTGVIVLAATNRPEVLDHALLRPGRFDRQVVIDAPDKVGRVAILKVHTRTKPLARDVDLEKVAQATPGFSGADLANAVNEAALIATRLEHTEISQQDLTDAIEKVIAGPERKSRRLGEKEKERVAFHEAGHALVAAYCKEADPVRKISIVPRGKAALGYTLQVPEIEKFIMTQGALTDRIRGLLGGRAAEELVFNELSTGAENDLQKATALAQQMICFYGMGKKVGMTHYGEKRPQYLAPNAGGESVGVNCSPETARKIDEEIDRILSDSYREAKDILRAHRVELDAIATELLQRETIEEADMKAILQRFGPGKPVSSPSLVRQLGVRQSPETGIRPI